MRLSKTSRALRPLPAALAFALTSGLITAATGCSVAPSTEADAEQIGATNAPLARESWAQLWTARGGRIPVCYDTIGVNGEAWAPNMWSYEKAISRDVIERGWAQAANVFFEGWNDCPTSGDDKYVRIQIGLNQFNDGGADGQSTSYGMFDFRKAADGPSVKWWWEPDHKAGFSRLQYVALHEFGHVLGFIHEQDRPDAPTAGQPGFCVNSIDNSGVGVTGFDTQSIMNYCGPNGGLLSELDIEGVRSLYGRKYGQSYQTIDSSDIVVLGADRNLWLEHNGTAVFPPPRTQIDGNVQSFQALDTSNVFVLGTDGNLWTAHAPFGALPPRREQVDGNVRWFQALSGQSAIVLGNDGKLWFEHGPFGAVPPQREQIDGNVDTFEALSTQQILVLGADKKLWLEFAPFGAVPPARVQIDGNVRSFKAIDSQTIAVLGTDGKLWLEHGPFGIVPPARTEIDAGVRAFQPIDAQNVVVLARDGNLWLEHAPFGIVPPHREQIDGNVFSFHATDLQNITVLGSDGFLWNEHAPFGTVPPRRDVIDGNVAE